MSQDETLYRVRDRNWTKVWGVSLTHAEATKLKEEVVATRKSRTARVEPMSVAEPDWYVRQQQAAEQAVAASVIATSVPTRAAAHGVVRMLEGSHELVINGTVRPVPASVSIGDVVYMRMMEPDLAAARSAGLAAAAPLAAAAQQRATGPVPEPIPQVEVDLGSDDDDDDLGIDIPSDVDVGIAMGEPGNYQTVV